MPAQTDIMQDGSIKRTLEIPETLPLLPVRDLVVFPYMVVPLMVSRPLSAEAIHAALATPDRLVLIAAQRNEREDEPKPEGLHAVGTIAMVMRMRKLSDGRIKVLVQGLLRARTRGFAKRAPAYEVRVERLDDLPALEPHVRGAEAELEALLRSVKDDLQKYADGGKALSPELISILGDVDEPGRLADLVASNLTIKVDAGQPLLEERRPMERLRVVSAILRKEVEILELQASIQTKAREEMSRTQREYFLREQLKQIQSELGGGGGGKGELDGLAARIAEVGLPEEALKEAERQLRRLESMHADSVEAGVIRAYLEWLVEVPWRDATEDQIDLAAARQVLDEDHHGLADVKDRILEHLSVLKLRRLRAPRPGGERTLATILCFAGPPGVGKTSLGRSIARALGRRFVRISLGGVRDEAEIRGHRRTYVGALPGRIVQAMRQAGTVNPLIVLDEIDKLGGDFRGDPGSALLEVLDPEQNHGFRDHYLGVAYDLSRVLFIATANATDPIPKALADRMEVIRLAGYAEEEKLEIARRHVVPRQVRAAGLHEGQVVFTNPALRSMVADYTREAGLRDLERQVAQVCRKVARRVAEGHDEPVTVAPASLRKWLGAPQPRLGQRNEADEIGVATGLAWTPFGGEVLRVEVQAMPGRGNLILTGQLGDVMKESAMTALSFARARAAALGIAKGFYAEHEIHVHVPAGAVPKDGPSAGVTICAAVVSLLSGRAVRSDVAMTGELTLRGRVLGVGGLKEKLLAAARAGVSLVIAPEENRRDLEEIDKRMLRGMKLAFARTMDEVLEHALAKKVVKGKRGRRS